MTALPTVAMIPAEITSGTSVYVHQSMNNGDYYCLLGKESDPKHQWKYNVDKSQSNTVYFSNKLSQGSVWVLPDINAPEGSEDPIMVTKGEVPRTVRGAKSNAGSTGSVSGSIAPFKASDAINNATAAAAAATTSSSATAGSSSNANDVRARLQEQIKARLLQKVGGAASAPTADATTATAASDDAAHLTPNSKQAVGGDALNTTVDNVELSPLTNNDPNALSPKRMEDVANDGNSGGAATRTLSRLEALRLKRAAAGGGSTTPRSSTPLNQVANNSNNNTPNGNHGGASPSSADGGGGGTESVAASDGTSTGGKMSARERLALYRQKKAGGGGAATPGGHSTPRGASLTPTEFGFHGGNTASVDPHPTQPDYNNQLDQYHSQQQQQQYASPNSTQSPQPVRNTTNASAAQFTLEGDGEQSPQLGNMANDTTNNVTVSGGTALQHHATAAAILAEKQAQMLLDDEALQRDKAELVRQERLLIEQRRRALMAKAAEEEALAKVMASRRRMEEERLAMEAKAMAEEEARRSKARSASRSVSVEGGGGGGNVLIDEDVIVADAAARLEQEHLKFLAEQQEARRRADIVRSRALSYSDAIADTLRLAVEEQAKEREKIRREREQQLTEERERIELAMAQRLSAADEAYLNSVGGADGKAKASGKNDTAAAPNGNKNSSAPSKPARYPKAFLIPYSNQYKYIGSAVLNPQLYQARLLMDAAGLSATNDGLTHRTNTSLANGGGEGVNASRATSSGKMANASGFSAAAADPNSALSRFLVSTDPYISNSNSRAVLASAGAMHNPKGGLAVTSPTKGPTAAAAAASNGLIDDLKERSAVHYAKDGPGVYYYNTAADNVHSISVMDAYAKGMKKQHQQQQQASTAPSGDEAKIANTNNNPFRVLEALSFYEGEWEDDVPHGIGTLSAPNSAYHGGFDKGRIDGRGTLQTRKLYASMDFVAGVGAKGSAVVETSAGETFAGAMEKNRITTPGSMTLAAVPQQQQQQRPNVASTPRSNANSNQRDPPQAAIPSENDTMEWVWGGGGGGTTPHSASTGLNNKATPTSQANVTPGTGQARIRYANGDLYVGPVVDYKPHTTDGLTASPSPSPSSSSSSPQPSLSCAEGTYRFRDGTTYTGAFKEGVVEGKGTYRFASGNVYAGEVRGGLFHGRGVYTRVGEFTYDGQWAEGKMHGNATVTFSNGDVWEGVFIKDVKGQGRYVKSAQFLLAPPPRS